LERSKIMTTGGSNHIVILRETAPPSDSGPLTTFLDFQELRRQIDEGRFFHHLFRYEEASLRTQKIAVLPKPLLIGIVLRLMATKRCYLHDEHGGHLPISLGYLAARAWRVASERLRLAKVLRRIEAEVERLHADLEPRKNPWRLDPSAFPVYLRTDLWFGVKSGGSVGHISGVVNNLDHFTAKPVLLTTDLLPLVREDIERHVIPPGPDFWDFLEVPSLHFNELFERRCREILKTRKPSFFYQRYSLNNYSGVNLARTHDVPLVLEYNGSEIWISRHWAGKPLKYEELSERIEMVNLSYADMIVVVSRPMKDELVGRGIEPEKILVNPNGVDPERYSPGIDGSAVRKKYRLDERVVIGFIGTFGKWHGAEVLTEAFGLLLERIPRYRETLRLLMVGDGVNMPLVRKAIEWFRMADCCILTGLVPQEEGPRHLAACDILASPHVPNPDGTPFFGSPTKLFEYMAMEKGIVASDLDQIGEVLEHGRTAWMVGGGDAGSLAAGLERLVEDERLRKRLGEAARREAIERYTWRKHTRKIIEKLRERCGED
jgi:glycosyltransferase involved in cell wall biosynthesis